MSQIRIVLALHAVVATMASAQATTSGPSVAAGPRLASPFRDCPRCPEMVVIPAGHFTMGYSASEKTWAVSQGFTPRSVSDEAPQHAVSIRVFALGKFDVTRAEYAAFVGETNYPAGDGCGRPGGKWDKNPDLSWERPGFAQTDGDPVVCVSWQDARAYIAWLNRDVRTAGATPGDGPYRLPTEAEWEYAARANTSA